MARPVTYAKLSVLAGVLRTTYKIKVVNTVWENDEGARVITVNVSAFPSIGRRSNVRKYELDLEWTTFNPRSISGTLREAFVPRDGEESPTAAVILVAFAELHAEMEKVGYELRGEEMSIDLDILASSMEGSVLWWSAHGFALKNGVAVGVPSTVIERTVNAMDGLYGDFVRIGARVGGARAPFSLVE